MKKRMVFIPLVNTSFRIPSGAPDQEVTASLPVLPDFTGEIYQVVPHMHLLGKKIEVTRSNPFS